MDDEAAGDDAVGREATDAEQRAAEAAVRYAVRLMSRGSRVVHRVVFGDLASDLVHSILATPGGHSEDDERADEWCRRYPA